jgi:hypothetical protein
MSNFLFDLCRASPVAAASLNIRLSEPDRGSLNRSGHKTGITFMTGASPAYLLA